MALRTKSKTDTDTDLSGAVEPSCCMERTASPPPTGKDDRPHVLGPTAPPRRPRRHMESPPCPRRRGASTYSKD